MAIHDIVINLQESALTQTVLMEIHTGVTNMVDAFTILTRTKKDGYVIR